ncbi:ANTAR domain-containing protein [Nocardia sp. NPDC127579]|uniref:ANTAR domain-containing protein n=1 Tax=Nocardia sp. NPDC127579 TaxID=3345402 RepID=UPI003643A647
MSVDHKALVTTLSRFARLLPTDYDAASALDGLVCGVTEVLGLSGAGATLESEAQPRVATVSNDRIDRIQLVATIPMRLDGTEIGTVALYGEPTRHWSADDLEVARVLTDLATGYVLNAGKRQGQQRLTDQLQRALRSRVVIEQAKGIVAHHRGITPDAAFELIRRHSRDHQARLSAVAHAIVDAGLRV